LTGNDAENCQYFEFATEPIEMVHMMRKQQAKYACNPQPSLAEPFDLLAA
jgi:hypothetical protein